jgi:hypothetical protein
MAHLEELRFAKERQWAVAIATITFIAGAFHMAHTVKQPLAYWEKWVATIVVSIVAIAGSLMLFNLQYHLRRTRLIIDWRDRRPLRRGLGHWIGDPSGVKCRCCLLFILA